MFAVIDHKDSRGMLAPLKSGFKTAAQANNWCKKNLPKDEVHFWGSKDYINKRYCVVKV